MILAKEFNRSAIARDSDFTLSTSSTISSPRQQQQQQRQPVTIAQFGANVPLELARASSLVAPYVSGVDLNCGCPQSWACAETLGAALMERRELVRDMVLETRRRLREDGWAVGLEADAEDPRGRSVSVKIRVHKDLRFVVLAFFSSYCLFFLSFFLSPMVLFAMLVASGAMWSLDVIHPV